MKSGFISNKDESVRMFRSDFMEFLSHVHPAVPHLLYVPVVAVSLYMSYRGGIGTGMGVTMFVCGLVVWSFTEYVIHRFAFHVPEEVDDRAKAITASLEPGEPVLGHLGMREKVYFLMHGVHHFYPNDSLRLVMVPGVSVPLAIAFYFAFTIGLGSVLGPALFAGFVVGYLMYDTTHFVVHHHPCRGRISASLKKWHMRHHYVDPDSDYGVSSPAWDFVWGTWGGRKKPAKKSLA